MKMSVVNNLGSAFETVEGELDQPIGYEVHITVKASGLCHSDLHIRDEGYGSPFPTLLGHEIAGIVENVGELVTEFKKGDHVVGCLIQFCGHCQECLSGHTYLCEHPEYTLRTKDQKPRVKFKNSDQFLFQQYGLGGFAGEALVHQHQLAKVPDEIPFDKACILGCSTVTGAGAIINTAHIRPGDSVAIIGTGGVGLNAISGAKVAGATTIIAIDLVDEKLEFAKKFGATHTINSGKEDAIAKVREITNGGVNAAFEVIGLIPTAQQAIGMARKGGGAYLIGLQKPKTEIPVPGFEGLIAQNKKIEGVWMGSTNLKHDIPMYAKMYLEGRMNLDDLVSETISIDEVDDAFRRLKEGKVLGRSVITSF
ncbi:Zn-dependent alcohol dehydrogenase [Chryseobacterium sp.]|uniref:Zn-dependent alcohol dehydrogenase n=1 Tax=Chryseobacterium sp. TaxID=1871047 RepID=UPI0025C22F48|nr:Zn-dependent alcohol dehydrogenase [Chryseobacterium sp.]